MKQLTEEEYKSFKIWEANKLAEEKIEADKKIITDKETEIKKAQTSLKTAKQKVIDKTKELADKKDELAVILRKPTKAQREAKREKKKAEENK